MKQWEDPRFIKIRKRNPSYNKKSGSKEPEYIEENVPNPKYNASTSASSHATPALTLTGQSPTFSGHLELYSNTATH